MSGTTSTSSGTIERGDGGYVVHRVSDEDRLKQLREWADAARELFDLTDGQRRTISHSS